MLRGSVRDVRRRKCDTPSRHVVGAAVAGSGRRSGPCASRRTPSGSRPSPTGSRGSGFPCRRRHPVAGSPWRATFRAHVRRRGRERPVDRFRPGDSEVAVRRNGESVRIRGIGFGVRDAALARQCNSGGPPPGTRMRIPFRRPLHGRSRFVPVVFRIGFPERRYPSLP